MLKRVHLIREEANSDAVARRWFDAFLYVDAEDGVERI